MKKEYPNYETILRSSEADTLFSEKPEDHWNVIPRPKRDSLFTLRGLYNTLIDGYGKGGALDKAWATYEEMKQKDIAPDAVTYGILSSTYWRCIGDYTRDSIGDQWYSFRNHNCGTIELQ
jgi:pentatricopeptide repeat protein